MTSWAYQSVATSRPALRVVRELLQPFGYFQNARQTMRALDHMRAFARYRTGQLPNSRRVVIDCVYLDVVAMKLAVECFQYAFQELPGGIVVAVRQTDGIQQMSAVAGIVKKRIGPAFRAQIVPYLAGSLQCSLMLTVSGRYSAGPFVIDVNWQPAVLDNLVVFGAIVILYVVTELVTGASQQVRMTTVDQYVDAHSRQARSGRHNAVGAKHRIR